MKTRIKLLICLLFVFDNSVEFPLLGNVVDPLVSPLDQVMDFKSGSNLQLLDMISHGLLETPDGGVVENGGDVVHYHTDTIKVKKEDGDLWPDAIIPYMFHQSVDEEHKNLIKEAMAHWGEHTCIQFRRKTPNDKHYLRFRTDTSGCWSAVGRQTDRPGAQDISLGAGCFKFYTAIHEIGHTLGYFHEHSRKDRDQYVEIIWKNVKPAMKVQFAVKNTRNEMFEYDYLSVMHYPAWAFSKTPLKENVILSKSPFSQYQIDEEKNSLSFRDIKLTNTLYECSEKCTGSKIQCQNNGILIPNKSNTKKCVCTCPPGFSGKSCEIRSEKDIPRSPKCGGVITKPGIITTPGYPKRKEGHQSCSYWIKAPINHKVRVTFEDFHFAKAHGAKAKSSSGGLCLYESVEIRKSDNIYEGSIYCGKQIPANTQMESEERDFIIVIIADDQRTGTGLKAKVEFFEDKSSPVKEITEEPHDSSLLGGVLGLG